MNLAALLQPMEPAQFLRDHWERQPVILRGAAERFRGLFASSDLGALLHYLRPKSPHGMLLVKGSNQCQLDWLDADGGPRVDKVRAAWRDGYSIVVNDLGSLWAPVGELAAALQEELHHPVDVNLYLTPGDTQAFVPHFDVMDTFVLQVEGSKRWEIRGAAAELPFADEHHPVAAEHLPPVELEETLNVGDVLYIPRGFVHSARATGTHSLHLTVGVHVVRWLDLLTAAVAALRRRDPRLRRALPPHFLDDGADAMQSAFDALLRDVPGAVKLDDALSQLADRLLVKRRLPPPADWVARDVDIAPDAIVSRRRGVVCRVIEGPDHAGIQYTGGSLVGPRKIAQAMRHVARHRRFAVRELTGELAEKETLVLVRRLVRDGVLTVE